jgi:DNA-binding transcriptional regulator YiaG
MKKLQCAKCGQLFWTDLQVEEAIVASGEWIKIPCPKCAGEWVIVEPGARRPGAATRRRRPGAGRRIRPKEAVGEKPAVLTPSQIRNIRKKLGLSQKDLAAFAAVNRGTVIAWEQGKFKPKKEKIVQLAALSKRRKEDVRKLLGEKMKQQGRKPQAGKPKGRRGPSQRAVKPPKK